MDVDERFDRLARLAGALLQVPSCAIVRSGADAAPDAAPDAAATFASDLRSRTLRSREPVIVPDVREDARFAGRTSGNGLRFYIGVPLHRSSGEVWGALELVGERARTLSPTERSLVVGIGRWAEAEMELVQLESQLRTSERERGRAVEHTRRLEAELDRKTEQFEAAGTELESVALRFRATVDALGESVARLALHNEFNAVLTRPDIDSDAIPDLLVRRLVDVVGDLGAVLVPSADGRRIEPIAVHHRDRGSVASMRWSMSRLMTGAGAGFATPTIRDGEVLHLPETSETAVDDLGGAERSVIETLGLTSLMVLPLPVDGEIAGAVLIARTRGEGALTLGDLHLAEDLTERAGEVMYNLRSRLVLEESEHRFRRLADNAPDVIYRARVPGFRLEYVSPIAESILGYTPQELCTTPGLSLRIIHPDDRPIMTSMLDDPGEIDPKPILMRWICADGEVLWMQHRIAPVLDDRGRVIAVEGIARDITALKRAQDDLTHQTLHDALTGLPNRQLFAGLLESALRRVHRRGTSIAVLYIDLDRFKVINDSLGHQAGDQLLVAIADRFRELVRPEDAIARLGGDELAVLIECDLDSPVPAQLAERILRSLDEPIMIEGQQVFTTASIGIASTHDAAAEPNDLLRHADVAMYQAKSAGGGRYEIFDERLRETIQHRLSEENALRQAADRGELRVLYQPITRISSGEIVAVEALARWQRGPVLAGADSFIGLAEDTGLIVPIGAWILEQAFADAERINRGRGRDLRLHVNVSTRQFASDVLIDTATEIAQRSQGSGTSLCLEITESTLMARPGEAIPLLNRFHTLGITIAMDDFGTGHSSLSNLRHLPIDSLKIDRSFIRGIDEDAAAASIVTAIISLARTMGLLVTAEGVETAEQLATLDALACEEAQGFYLGHPLTAGELAEVLAV